MIERAALVDAVMVAMHDRGESESIGWGPLELSMATYRVLARAAVSEMEKHLDTGR